MYLCTRYVQYERVRFYQVNSFVIFLHHFVLFINHFSWLLRKIGTNIKVYFTSCPTVMKIVQILSKLWIKNRWLIVSSFLPCALSCQSLRSLCKTEVTEVWSTWLAYVPRRRFRVSKIVTAAAATVRCYATEAVVAGHRTNRNPDRRCLWQTTPSVSASRRTPATTWPISGYLSIAAARIRAIWFALAERINTLRDWSIRRFRDVSRGFSDGPSVFCGKRQRWF